MRVSLLEARTYISTVRAGLRRLSLRSSTPRPDRATLSPAARVASELNRNLRITDTNKLPILKNKRLLLIGGTWALTAITGGSLAGIAAASLALAVGVEFLITSLFFAYLVYTHIRAEDNIKRLYQADKEEMARVIDNHPHRGEILELFERLGLDGVNNILEAFALAEAAESFERGLRGEVDYNFNTAPYELRDPASLELFIGRLDSRLSVTASLRQALERRTAENVNNQVLAILYRHYPAEVSWNSLHPRSEDYVELIKLLRDHQELFSPGLTGAAGVKIAELAERLKRDGDHLGLYHVVPDRGGTDRHYFIFAAAPDCQKGKLIPGGCFFASGAMAELYLGIDLESGEGVAFKVNAKRDDPVLSRAFAREGEIQAKIDHPRVVRVLGQRGDELIVMELVKLPPLGRYLDVHKKLPLSQAVSVADKLCEVAGAIGVHHRDLCPNNVFFDPDTGEVKITDFGIAVLPGEAIGSETSDTYTAGVYRYMSPAYIGAYQRIVRNSGATEQAEDILIKNDIFAIGATLYRALTGHFVTWDRGDRQVIVASDDKPKNASEIAIGRVYAEYNRFQEYLAAGRAQEAAEIKRKYMLVRKFDDEGVEVAPALYEVISRMTAFDPAEGFSSFSQARQALGRALFEAVLFGQVEIRPEEKRRVISLMLDIAEQSAELAAMADGAVNYLTKS